LSRARMVPNSAVNVKKPALTVGSSGYCIGEKKDARFYTGVQWFCKEVITPPGDYRRPPGLPRLTRQGCSSGRCNDPMPTKVMNITASVITIDVGAVLETETSPSAAITKMHLNNFITTYDYPSYRKFCATSFSIPVSSRNHLRLK
jgi:hypothetical protein